MSLSRFSWGEPVLYPTWSEFLPLMQPIRRPRVTLKINGLDASPLPFPGDTRSVSLPLVHV